MNITLMLESFAKLGLIYCRGCYLKDYQWGMKFSNTEKQIKNNPEETCVLTSKEFVDNCTMYELQVVIDGHTVFGDKGMNEELFHKMVIKSMLLIYQHQHPECVKDEKDEETTENAK